MGTTEKIILILSLALLAIVALRPSIRGNDGVGHYVYLASMLRGADLDFRDDYRAFDDLKQYAYKFSELPVSSKTGHPSNRYGIGASLLWSPFVLTTHLGLMIWAPDRADGISRPYEWAVAIATAFWGSLGLAMLYIRLRRTWPLLSAAGALSALIFATPLGFYLYAHGSMAHGVEFFAATLVLLTFEKTWQKKPSQWYAACGASLGFLVMIRFQTATWPIALGILLGWKKIFSGSKVEKTGDSQWKPIGDVLLLMGSAFVVFIPQLIVWHLLYGKWYSGPMPYVDGSAGYFIAWPKYLLHALMSEKGGVLAWHPIIAVGIVSLILMALRDQKQASLATAGLLGFGVQVWLVGCWSVWWAGASFGNRFFISSLPWIAVGVAVWLATPHRASQWRRLIIVAVLIVWNLGLLVQYALELVPRDKSVPWSQVIRQNLMDVPRIAWQRLWS